MNESLYNLNLLIFAEHIWFHMYGIGPYRYFLVIFLPQAVTELISLHCWYNKVNSIQLKRRIELVNEVVAYGKIETVNVKQGN